MPVNILRKQKSQQMKADLRERSFAVSGHCFICSWVVTQYSSEVYLRGLYSYKCTSMPRPGFRSVFILPGSGSSILGWIPIRIRIHPEFLWPKLWKNVQLKKYFCWSKIAIYLSLGHYKGRPSYRRSLQPSKENIRSDTSKHEISKFFAIIVGHFALLDPNPDTDPLTWLNQDPIRLRIRNTGKYIQIPRINM